MELVWGQLYPHSAPHQTRPKAEDVQAQPGQD